jgi:O-acetyl-ADP-ribose deacetylase (regulator of RNase III)
MLELSQMQNSGFDFGAKPPSDAAPETRSAPPAGNSLLVFPVLGPSTARTDSRGRRRTTPFVELVFGDITSEHTDAIVNPAGPGLVDLAIRRLAGPGLLDAYHQGTRELPGAKLLPGHAFVTQGFGLKAAHIVHCGPPIYAENAVRARSDLASCHAEALRLARARAFSSISFPAIATGVYRYPLAEAADVAVTTVTEELREHGSPSLVRFVLFSEEAFQTYSKAAESLLGPAF